MDEHSYSVKEYNVQSNPTYIYVVDGEEVRRSTGNQSVNSLKQMYRKSFF